MIVLFVDMKSPLLPRLDFTQQSQLVCVCAVALVLGVFWFEIYRPATSKSGFGRLCLSVGCKLHSSVEVWRSRNEVRFPIRGLVLLSLRSRNELNFRSVCLNVVLLFLVLNG